MTPWLDAQWEEAGRASEARMGAALLRTDWRLQRVSKALVQSAVWYELDDRALRDLADEPLEKR